MVGAGAPKGKVWAWAGAGAPKAMRWAGASPPLISPGGAPEPDTPAVNDALGSVAVNELLGSMLKEGSPPPLSTDVLTCEMLSELNVSFKLLFKPLGLV